MSSRKLSDEVSVASQIGPDDVAEIAAVGFQSIVCNRPDGEAHDQPAFAEIEQAAKAAGLEILWQPIVSGGLSPADGEQFGDIVDRLAKPVLAYCRTGTRCTALWSLSQAGKMPSDDIVRAAAEAGYDMRGLMPQLEAIKAAKG